jgi:hypothetical protein
MNFRSLPEGDVLAPRSVGPETSTPPLQVAKGIMSCHEETPPAFLTARRYVECSTPDGWLSAGFYGSDEDAAVFYRVIGSVRHTK